jgi:autotransporter-associated beta strand protein
LTLAERRNRLVAIALLTSACGFLGAPGPRAQVRGVYPLGMSGTSSGITPEPGFTYSNQFLYYGRDELVDADGDVTATGRQSVLMDMNSFIWVWKREILGGARFSVSATLPIANNSLSSDATGALSGGGGFIKTGSGVMTITSSQSYAGATIITPERATPHGRFFFRENF